MIKTLTLSGIFNQVTAAMTGGDLTKKYLFCSGDAFSHREVNGISDQYYYEDSNGIEIFDLPGK
jgi:hypothetical protein